MNLSLANPDWLKADAAGEMVRLQAAPGSLELLAAEGEGAKKLRRFSLNAYNGGAMLANLYWPVVIDLAGMSVPNQAIPILKDHDPTQIVGHTQKIELTSRTIKMSGVISGVGEATQEVLATADNGFPWGTSVGAMIERLEFVEAKQTVQVNGKNFSGPLYVARKTTLRETSFTAVAADAGTWSEITAQYSDPRDTMNFEQWLTAQGLEIKTLSQTQIDNLKKVHAALHTPRAADAQPTTSTPAASAPAPAAVPGNTPATPVTAAASPASAAVVAAADPLSQLREATARELERQEVIRRLAANHPAIASQAVRDNWDATRTELEVLRASRPTGPAIHVPGASGGTNAPAPRLVLEAALCQAGQLPHLDRHYEAPVLEAAQRHYRGRIGLQELFLEAAWAAGYTGRSFRRDMQGVLTAAFSQLDIAGILSNVANKTIREAFMNVESVWSKIAAIGSVSDFKTRTAYSLTGDLMYEQIGPTGEIKHGTMGEISYTNKANSYAKLLTITREDLINDDLDAIAGNAPKRLGRGAALKINDVFWAIFLNNASFFTAGRNNYAAGATTVLGIDSLTTFETLFLNQTDPDGRPLGAMPKFLLVPNALKVTAELLYKSLEMRDNTANTKTPTMNPHAGKFEVVNSTYLSNAAYTGNSTTAWYLLGDPNDLPVIEIVFLDGQQQPTIEAIELNPDRLGVGMRGYHDFGVALQEYRGGVKSKGAA